MYKVGDRVIFLGWDAAPIPSSQYLNHLSASSSPQKGQVYSVTHVWDKDSVEIGIRGGYWYPTTHLLPIKKWCSLAQVLYGGEV